MDGMEITNESNERFWCTQLRCGKFKMVNEPRRRPELEVNNDKLQVIDEADLSQTTKKLAAWFGTHNTDLHVIICINLLHKISKKNRKIGTTQMATLQQHAMKPFLCQ